LIEKFAVLVVVIVGFDYPPVLTFTATGVPVALLAPGREAVAGTTLAISGELVRVSIAPGVALQATSELLSRAMRPLAIVGEKAVASFPDSPAAPVVAAANRAWSLRRKALLRPHAGACGAHWMAS